MGKAATSWSADGTGYGITAGELHDRVIADLRQFCEHRGLETDGRLEDPIPLVQKIRLVLEWYADHELESLKAEGRKWCPGMTETSP